MSHKIVLNGIDISECLAHYIQHDYNNNSEYSWFFNSENFFIIINSLGHWRDKSSNVSLNFKSIYNWESIFSKYAFIKAKLCVLRKTILSALVNIQKRGGTPRAAESQAKGVLGGDFEKST